MKKEVELQRQTLLEENHEWYPGREDGGVIDSDRRQRNASEIMRMHKRVEFAELEREQAQGFVYTGRKKFNLSD